MFDIWKVVLCKKLSLQKPFMYKVFSIRKMKVQIYGRE